MILELDVRTVLMKTHLSISEDQDSTPDSFPLSFFRSSLLSYSTVEASLLFVEPDPPNLSIMASSWVHEWSRLLTRDDSYHDNVKEMTFGRRVARYLSQYAWYNPQRDHHPNAPSIDRAWEYFEHVTLARHFKSDEKSIDVNRKAQVGECESSTTLYSVLGTPEADLGDFGIGVGELVAWVH